MCDVCATTTNQQILQRLGESLEKNPEFFGQEICRPGNIVDYVLKNAKDKKCSLRVIWRAVIEGFETVWPENLSGVRRGDVWVYNPLKRQGMCVSVCAVSSFASLWRGGVCLYLTLLLCRAVLCCVVLCRCD
jgi:hypothetical protein